MRLLCLLILTSALIVGCEDKDDEAPITIDTWLRIYPGIGATNNGGGLCATNDGGCAALVTYVNRTYVYKFNSRGSLQWERELVGIGGEVGKIAESRSGDLFVTGATFQQPSDLFVARIPADGDTIIEHAINLGDSVADGWAILPTNDNGVVIGGRLDYQFAVFKLNHLFDTLWVCALEGPRGGSAEALALWPDGRILAGGDSSAVGFLMVLNSDGSIERKITLPEYEYISGVAISSEGMILIAGRSDFSAITMVLDRDFNIVSRSVQTEEYGIFVRGIALGDNELPTIIGTLFASGGNGEEIWIRQSRHDGSVNWTSSYLTAGDDLARSIAADNNGGFFVLGTLLPGVDLILMRINETGDL